MAHSESIEIVTRKFKQKMMNKDFQLRITFEILLCNEIFALLRIMDTPLKIFK